MSAPDLVLLLGGPKPARWPTVGAAGVGAHGRRALSCTRPVAMAKAAAAPGRLWAARHIVATRRGRPRHCLGPPPLAPLSEVGPEVARASRRQCWPAALLAPRARGGGRAHSARPGSRRSRKARASP